MIKMISDIKTVIAACIVAIIIFVIELLTPRANHETSKILGGEDDKIIETNTHIVCDEANACQTLREYARWNALNTYYEDVARQLSDRQKYEFKNILERYVISSANTISAVLAVSATVSTVSAVSTQPTDKFTKTDDILLCVDTAAIDRMKTELSKNKIMAPVGRFVRVVEDFLKSKDFDPVNISIDIGDLRVVVQCDKFKYTLTRRRYNALFGRSNNNNDIVRMLLRYECLFPGGQQWGSSEAKYTMLHDNYNVRLEGFASPKNSQLLYHKDSYFCSLFYDTDKVFGSRGSYFNINFAEFAAEVGADLPYVGLAVCPPYILHIMDDAMRKVISELESAKRAGARCLVIFLCPDWTDADYIRIGEQAANKCYDMKLPAMKHSYVNTSAIDENTNEPPLIPARFPSRLFAFSTENFNLPNFDKLTETYYEADA